MDEKQVRKAIDLGRQNDSTFILGESVVTTLLRKAYGDMAEEIKVNIQNDVAYIDPVALHREVSKKKEKDNQTAFERKLPQLIDVDLVPVFAKQIEKAAKVSLGYETRQFEKLASSEGIPLSGTVYKAKDSMTLDGRLKFEKYRVDLFLGVTQVQRENRNILPREPMLLSWSYETVWTILFVLRPEAANETTDKTFYYTPEYRRARITITSNGQRDDDGLRFDGRFEIGGLWYEWYDISVREAKEQRGEKE